MLIGIISKQLFGKLGPWVSLIALMIIAILALAGVPEALSASVCLLSMLIITIFNPFNGLCFLFFCFPFFLGESYHKWYFLLPSLAIVWMIATIVKFHRRHIRIEWNFLFPFLLLPICALICIPLMFKELLLAIWTLPVNVILQQLILPSYTYPVFGFCHFFDLTLLCLLTPIMVKCFELTKINEKVHAIFAFTVLVIVYCISSILIFHSGIFGTYLGATFVGHLAEGIAGMAYNRAYFGTWLVWSLPFIIMNFQFNSARKWTRALAITAGILVVICLGLNGQKANIISLIFLMLIISFNVNFKRFLYHLIAIFGILFAIIAIDIFFLNSFLFNKLTAFNPLDNYYYVTWLYSISLWKNSLLLGVGTGAFAWWYPWAPESISNLDKWFTWGNAHSQWMQLLSEQGLLGVICFAAVITYILYYARFSFRNKTLLTQARIAYWGLLLITLSSFWQTFLHIRVFYMWWAFLFALAFSCIPQEVRPRWNKSIAITLSAIFIALFAFRVADIVNEQPRPGFRSGFYVEENFEGSKPGYWIGQKAVFVLSSERRKFPIDLSVTSFLPGLSENPQKLTIWADDIEPQHIIIKDKKWQTIRITLKNSLKPIVLYFKAKYQLNPAKLGWSTDDRNLSAVVSFE